MLSLGKPCFSVSLLLALCHMPRPFLGKLFPLSCSSVSPFFCPSYSLLLLCHPCGTLQSLHCVHQWVLASAKCHMGGDKLWSPLSFSDQYIRHWAPGTPGSCSGSWHPDLKKGDSDVSKEGAALQ